MVFGLLLGGDVYFFLVFQKAIGWGGLGLAGRRKAEGPGLWLKQQRRSKLGGFGCLECLPAFASFCPFIKPA